MQNHAEDIVHTLFNVNLLSFLKPEFSYLPSYMLHDTGHTFKLNMAAFMFIYQNPV